MCDPRHPGHGRRRSDVPHCQTAPYHESPDVKSGTRFKTVRELANSGLLLRRRNQLDSGWYMSEIDPRLPDILRDSFCIRTSMIRRRSGGTRTVETTYYWNGARQIVLSGYPGPRDWVANINANPTVTLHTAEFEPSFDIPGRAEVLWDTNERLPHLLNFIGRWTERPGFPRRRFAIALGAIRLNRKLRLPWWGPFCLIRKILDQMPCVVVTFTGEPTLRLGGPPALSEPHADRP